MAPSSHELVAQLSEVPLFLAIHELLQRPLWRAPPTVPRRTDESFVQEVALSHLDSRYWADRLCAMTSSSLHPALGISESQHFDGRPRIE